MGEERLHRRGERIVGVVQQDVALADRGEDVLCAARFDFGDLTVRGRDERAVLEVRAVERLQFEQYGEVERRGQAVDLFRVDAELVGEQLGNRDSRCAMMRFSIVMNPKRSSRLSSSVRSSTGTRRGMLPGIFTRAKWDLPEFGFSTSTARFSELPEM